MLHFCDITGDRSMGFTDFRDYSVWHKSIMLAKEVHRLSKSCHRMNFLAYSCR